MTDFHMWVYVFCGFYRFVKLLHLSQKWLRFGNVHNIHKRRHQSRAKIDVYIFCVIRKVLRKLDAIVSK